MKKDDYCNNCPERETCTIPCEIMFCSEDWQDKYAILKLWQSAKDKKSIDAWNKRSGK